MLQLLHILLLSLHLICMNVASGAPLACLWLEWKLRSKNDGAAKSAADYLAKMSVLTLLAGSLIGLVMGLMLWTPEYASLWTKRLGHKMHWGGLELLFSLLILGGYWLWRKRSASSGMGGFLGKSALLLFASTNLLYHFPPLFLIAGKLADVQDASLEEVRGKLFVKAMLEGEIPALWVHFTFASLAMAGIMLLGLALRMGRRGAPAEEVSRVAIWGGYWGLIPSLLQLPVGLWVMSALPPGSQSRIMGSSGLATVFFLAGIVAALWLLRELVSVAMGETARSNLIRAMCAMVVVVVLMTGTHQCGKVRSEDLLKRVTRQSLFDKFELNFSRRQDRL
ncbi:MAG: hypothetical protein K8R36_21495 [Planctomycetales bacterium]|nr:hypothetical protein [Planctomycetales bacterium]